METTLDQKLIRLAFDPAAAEGEAVNAFLMYRRKFAKVPVLSVETPKPKKVKTSWNINLAAKKMDGLIGILSTWSDEPFYIIKYDMGRENLLSPWKFKLIVAFNTQDEMDRFNRYFDRTFDLL